MQIQITGCMFENMGRNMNTKSKVIVLPCEAYDEERIYTLMKNGLSQLGGLDNLINKEEKILLKPNLLKKAEVEKAVITHPVVVGAFARILREEGYKNIVLADSCGHGTTQAVIRGTGMDTYLEKYHIPDEVMQYIANNIKSNIRELEGSLNKLIALSNLENKPIDIPLAAEALKDMISPDDTRAVSPELIMDVVSEHFNVPVAELKGKKRNAEIVLPRQIVMYLCRNMTDTPLKSIGALLGGKDHASISHGVRKIENDLKTDEALNNTVNIIKKKINPV